MTGNCLMGSRPLLVFDSAFDNAWRKYTLDPETGANRLRVMSGLVLDFAGAINELLREEGLPEVEITSAFGLIFTPPIVWWTAGCTLTAQ